MSKFYKQSEDSTLCGPVAICNLLISLNKKPNPLKITILMKWNSHMGVTNRAISETLKHLKIKFVHKIGIKLPYIIQQLQKGHHIIFSYQYCQTSAHVMLLLGTKKKNNKYYILAINDISEKNKFRIKQWVNIDYYNGKSKRFGTYCSWKRFRMPQAWIIKS